MRLIRDEIRVAPVMFDGVARPFLGADIAPGALPATQVSEIGLVLRGATGTLHPEVLNSTGGAVNGADDGKFTEPVASAWDRVFGFEASSCAGVQVVPVFIK
jgi:hypothetical protein